MDGKITLYSNKELIVRIKQYAKEKNISVSSLVNEFFKSLLNTSNSKISANSIINELFGILKDSKIDKNDYKKIFRRKISMKILLDTNVILEYLFKREPFANETKIII